MSWYNVMGSSSVKIDRLSRESLALHLAYLNARVRVLRDLCYDHGQLSAPLGHRCSRLCGDPHQGLGPPIGPTAAPGTALQ